MSFYTLVVFSILLIAMGIYGGMSPGAIIGLLVLPFFYWWRTSVQNSATKDIGKPIPKDSKKIIKEEEPIMWDFKLKKTRIILVISIIWFFTSYFFIGTDGYDDWSIDNVMTHPFLYIMITPLFIYWIVIPSYRWVMKGR
jgi:hypothetical protein